MDLKLRRVQIENYAGLRKLVLDGFSDINVILGPNNVGKSTVLEAIAWVCGMVNFRKTPRTYPEGNLSTVVTGIFELINPDFVAEIERTAHDLGITDPALKNAFFEHARRFMYRLSASDHDYNNPKREVGLGITDPLGTENELLRQVITQGAENKGVQRLSNIVMERAKSAIKGLERDQVSIIPADRLARSYYTIDPNGSGTNRTSNQALHLWKESKFKRKTEDFIKQLAGLEPSFSIADPRSDGALYFELGEKAGEAIELPLSSKGGGENDAYELAARIGCVVKPLRFACLDEPENSKHPMLQRRVMEWLRKMSSTTQFFIATHSTIFAQPSPTTSIYALSREAGKPPISGAKVLTRDLAKNVRESLGSRNLDLLSFDKVLFLEGDTEERFVNDYLEYMGVRPSAVGIRLINLRSANNIDRRRVKDFLEFLRDTWVKPFIWLDKKPDIVKERAELLRIYSPFISEEQFRLWELDGRKIVDFEDMFPPQVLRAALEQLISAQGGNLQALIEFEQLLKEGAEAALEKTYAKALTVDRSSYPKAEVGGILAKNIAKEIQSAGGDLKTIESKYPVLTELRKVLES